MRNRTCKALALGTGAALALGLLGLASIADARPAKAAAEEAIESPAYEEVDSFTMLSRPWGWHAVDNNTVIVWATPFQPYLVELAYPSYDLKWVQTIGVTSFGSRVYSKFDSVQVRGFRYPIDSIYKMSREEARNLERNT